jgi:phenylacetate-CoA ligase
MSFDNIRVFSLKQEAEELIAEFDKFQPDFIGGYTGKLTHLALLKENGYGKKVNPIAMGSTGEPLDKHVTALVEEAFDTKCYNTYGATEPGPVAFECRKRNIHIDSDLIFCEFLKNGIPTKSEEPGNIVITKLFGRGTPIIRYTGMNDIVAPSTKTCNCGIKHRLIKKIFGRDNWYLIFPDGKIMLPSTISEIFGKVVYEYRTRMFKGIQMVQKDIKKLNVNIIINYDVKENTQVKDLIKSTKEEFYAKLGTDSDVDVIVKEVNRFDQEGYVISTLDKNKFEIKKYL